MSNAPPYMPLYWKDLLGDNNVRRMSTKEFGAYMLLLGAAWQEDPPATLPNDDQALARLAGLSLSEWQESKPVILSPFKLHNDGRYHQKRLRQVHAEVVAKSKANISRAKRAAKARWECSEHCSSTAQAINKDANQNQSQSTPPPNARAREGPEASMPTQAEVRTWGEMDGIPQELCDRFWRHYEAVGWRTNGQPITKPRTKLAQWRENEKQNGNNSNQNVKRGPDRNAHIARSDEYGNISRSPKK